jgi:hypothetical protein
MEPKIVKMNWKQRIIVALLNGLVYIGILWLFDYFTEDQLYSTNELLFQGLFFGFFMGIAFPFVVKKFGHKFTSSLSKNTIPILNPNETIVQEFQGNLFKGIGAEGGKIFLTSENLIFKSHQLYIQNQQTNIPLNSISKIEKRKTALKTDNRLRITTSDDKKYDFVLNESDDLITLLEEKNS